MDFKKYLGEGEGKVNEALMKQVHKARKSKGKQLQNILSELHGNCYEVLYNLDIALSDSFGKGNKEGIQKARVMIQKALNELGIVDWIKAMDIAFKGKTDLK